MRLRGLCATLLCMGLASATVVGCGQSSAEMQLPKGAEPFVYQDITFKGQPLKGVVASTVITRARAEQAIDFTSNDNKVAAVFIFGGDESALTVSPDFATPADVVFADRSGKVVRVLSGDSHGYTPEGVTNSRTGSRNAPQFFQSGDPASVAIFLSRGLAANIKPGESLATAITPNPFDAVNAADASAMRLNIRPRRIAQPESTPLKDPVVLDVRLAGTPEDRARGLRDGENAVLLMWPSQTESWLKEGFWLKGIKGEVSFAFLRMQLLGYRGGSSRSFNGSILDIVEGVSDAQTKDIERPIWWPSNERVETRDQMTNGAISGPVNAVLVIRGPKAFSERGIEENAWINTNSIYLNNPGGGESNSPVIADDNLKNMLVKVGDASFVPELFHGDLAANGALSQVASLKPQQIGVIVWDDASVARLANPHASMQSVALLEKAGNAANQFKVGSLFALEAGGEGRVDSASTRYALVGAPGATFNVASNVELPWQVVQLKPRDTRRGAFVAAGDPSLKHPLTAPEGSIAVQLEVADTPSAISQGLMGRDAASLPGNRGMLFVWGNADFRSFWMKNCVMDIDVAFLDADRRVISIKTMKKEPVGRMDHELERYESMGRAKYAVEMRGGWFAEQGIKVDSRLWLPSTLLEPARSE